MKIRIGDLVFYYSYKWINGKHTKVENMALVDGNENKWWCAEGLIGVHNPQGMGAIIEIKNVFSIIKREELKEWWDFI